MSTELWKALFDAIVKIIVGLVVGLGVPWVTKRSATGRRHRRRTKRQDEATTASG